MTDIAIVVVTAVLAVVFILTALLFTLPWILITGKAPRCILSRISRFIRIFKARKRWNFTEIEPGIFLGTLPRWPSHLEELANTGVGAVVALNESWELALSSDTVVDLCGMHFLHLPTPDYFAPSQEDLVAAVAFIDRHRREGRGVYVHCNGGKGRSAVCVICYLHATHGWSPEFAYQYVRERRKIADLRSLYGIRCQWQAVRKFCQNRETPQVTMPFSKVRVVPDGSVLPEGQKDISNRAKSPSGGFLGERLPVAAATSNTAVPSPIPSLVALHPAEVAVAAEHVHESPCAESGMNCPAEKSVVEAPLTEEHSDQAADASPAAGTTEQIAATDGTTAL